MYRHLPYCTAYVDGTFYNEMYGGAYCIFDPEGKVIYQDAGIGQNVNVLPLRNIAGEMSAAMHATLWIDYNVGKGTIIHDYNGLSKWVTGEWDTQNPYTEMYKKFMQPFYILEIINFQWVKGHTNVMGNEIVDKLARNAVIYKQQWKF